MSGVKRATRSHTLKYRSVQTLTYARCSVNSSAVASLYNSSQVPSPHDVVRCNLKHISPMARCSLLPLLLAFLVVTSSTVSLSGATHLAAAARRPPQDAVAGAPTSPCPCSCPAPSPAPSPAGKEPDDGGFDMSAMAPWRKMGPPISDEPGY
jgi:hypothetical protein